MRRHDGGFTFLFLLAALAASSIALAAVGQQWHEQGRREREEAVLKIGLAYARAIESYYRFSPAGQQALPPSVEALLSDARGGAVMRHIRRLYADPTQPEKAWRVVWSPQGRVLGVYIDSDERPLRVHERTVDGVQLPAATSYRQWQFIPKLDEKK